ncbi:MAG: hypothetical protein GQ583_09935, partial [Methyloprofundus sp.]|nr:hypothetical protein [Methyloprofundus sp.]
MSPLPRIQVYVSYNTVHTEQLTQLEAAFKNYNESDDSGYQMEVKYSENSIDEGDSIVEFMDKIALARFVVLFFS